MSEFEAIETQEQLDAIIGERLKRERETTAKKYEGYISPDDFATAKKEHEAQINKLNETITGAQEKIANHDKELADRDSKIKAYETASVKSRIAHEMGLSYDAVDFIKGDDEESIRKSAESLKALVGNTKTAPLADTEEPVGKMTDAAWRKTLAKMKGEE